MKCFMLFGLLLASFLAPSSAWAAHADTSVFIGPNGAGGTAHGSGQQSMGSVVARPNSVRSQMLSVDPMQMAFSSGIAEKTPFGIWSGSFGINVGRKYRTPIRDFGSMRPTSCSDFPCHPGISRGTMGRVNLAPYPTW